MWQFWAIRGELVGIYRIVVASPHSIRYAALRASAEQEIAGEKLIAITGH